MTQTYRSIIEYSGMNNNDERTSYSTRQLTYEDVEELKIKLRSSSYSWDEPRLVFSRPVFDIEIQNGLDIYSQTISTFDETIPECTKIIDGIFRFYQQFVVRNMEIKKFNPDLTLIKAINHYIAYGYYDCMSGGMNKYSISICRRIILTNNIPLTEKVYPGKEDSESDSWYTIGDFLESTKDIEDIEISINKLQKMLPTHISFMLDGIVPFSA